MKSAWRSGASVNPRKAAACTFAAVGRRLPSCRPPTTIVVPGVGVEVTDEVNFASMNDADNPKSQVVLGRAKSSISMPSLRAVGTLKTMREEQEPAVVVA